MFFKNIKTHLFRTVFDALMHLSVFFCIVFIDLLLYIIILANVKYL